MEILCPCMLRDAVAVKPPVSHSVMTLPSVYDENSLSQCKREEHIYILHWTMEEHTVLQKFISRGMSRSDQYKKKVKFQPRTGHKGPGWDQMCSSALSPTSRLVLGWVVIATSQLLYHRERPRTHCIGGWLETRASLDRCRKFIPLRDSIHGPSSP